MGSAVLVHYKVADSYVWCGNRECALGFKKTHARKRGGEVYLQGLAVYIVGHTEWWYYTSMEGATGDKWASKER